MNKGCIQLFRRNVWRFYHAYGRHDLPWRKTTDPYHILLSEIMLQQTQVDRVVSYYNAFLDTFPTVAALASAPLRDVLKLWSGLGYNRRAKMLHDAAKHVADHCDGVVPSTYEDLIALPGVGPYTASAVMAFAYNESVAMIETNIRTVYIHAFYGDKEHVHDRDILSLVENTASKRKPREWYWALMDYGSFLKKKYPNPSRKSAGHKKQSKFEGSLRQVRGAILKELVHSGKTKGEMILTLPFDRQRTEKAIEGLLGDGLITMKRARYVLAD